MFSYCKSLTKLDLSNFNTDNVINMSYMFTFCTSLESLDLSNFNSNDNTDIKYIFNSVDKNKCKIVCKDDKLLKEFEK
jgi:surface protein